MQIKIRTVLRLKECVYVLSGLVGHKFASGIRKHSGSTGQSGTPYIRRDRITEESAPRSIMSGKIPGAT